MHVEAEQYNHDLEALAAALPKWQDDDDKLSALIEDYKKQGKATDGLQIRLNYSIRRRNLLTNFCESTQQLITALQDELKQAAKVTTTQTNDTAARTLIRDLPHSEAYMFNYLRDLIIGAYESQQEATEQILTKLKELTKNG